MQWGLPHCRLWLRKELECDKTVFYQLCGFNIVWFLLLFPGSLSDSNETDAAVGLSQKSLFSV